MTLSVSEARELLEALRLWDEEVAEGHPDPEWHTHITDGDGNELTIAVDVGRS